MHARAQHIDGEDCQSIRASRPGIRQLGVVTFPEQSPHHPAVPLHPLPPRFHPHDSLTSHHQIQPTPSASGRGTRRGPISLSRENGGARRLAERSCRDTPTGRGSGSGTWCGSSGPHWPRIGRGTGSTGLAGAARHGGKHRDAGRHREERERPGRSRAGNQCRFRASTGHHAADYGDYNPPPRGRPRADCDSATGKALVPFDFHSSVSICIFPV